MTAGARRFPKGVNAGFSALLQLVKITEGLSHAGLQQELAQKVLVAVDSCQAQVQGCVKLLLEALALSKQQHSPELALDSAWALNELAQKSNVVSGWILGCGSTSLLRECLIVYCDRRDTVEICTWLVGKTGGLKGLLSLLRGDPALPQQVVVRVFDIICKDSSFWRDKDGPIEEAGQLLRCAAEAAKFAAQQGPRQLLEASCHLLQEMAAEPLLGQQLLQMQVLQMEGAIFMAQTLQMVLRDQDASTAQSCCSVLTSLTKVGRVNCQQRLRQEPVLEALTAAARLGAGGRLEEEAWRTMAHILGLPEAAKRLSHLREHEYGMHGVLSAIKNLATTEDLEEIRELPAVLEELLQLPPALAVAPLGAACASLAPQAAPGTVRALDAAVQVLVQRLREPVDVDQLEFIVDPLGRIALAQDAWKDVLLRLSTPEMASNRIAELLGYPRLEKYCVWLLATLGGLPYVAKELHQHMAQQPAVDACFCAIIDILDDDVDCEWLLKGRTETVTTQDAPDFVNLVVAAMQQHPQDALVQSRGCHCLALVFQTRLAQHVGELGQACMGRILTIVKEAYNSHYKKEATVRDICYLLRNLLEPSKSPQSNEAEFQAQRQIAWHLVEENMPAQLESSIRHFATYTEGYRTELFESALGALALLKGAGGVLTLLRDLEELPGCAAARAAGIKALFELGSNR
ncbi:unnamed protein product, partial [Effrenium voratum]